jgi:hypothetical protein
LIGRAWAWYRDRRDLREAEHRFKLHLDLKSLFPGHTYARLDEDLETIKRSLRKGRK